MDRRFLKKINNDFKIVCSQKSAELLDASYNHKENITIVKDNDTLDLGKGHVLKILQKYPNVHWPDTIVTLTH